MDLTRAVKKLRKFYKIHKRLPTYEEMVTVFGFSSTNASYYLVQKLIRAGVLAKGEKGKLIPRSLFAIPHLGRIRAGYPTAALELPDESIDVYDYIHDTTGDIYFLTVSGDSMRDALIGDGDKVIVDRHREPKVGDIVAALVDGEWTVKYYERRDGKIALVPANEQYPVIYPRESLFIGGVVTCVLRKYR